MSRTIHVTIGELVLHGFDPCDRHRIGAAVQAELGRRCAERFDAAPETAGRDRIDAGTVTLAGGVRSPQTGAAIATAVHAGLLR